MDFLPIIIWLLAVGLAVLYRRKTPGDITDFYTVYTLSQGVSLLIFPIVFYTLLFTPGVYLPVFFCFKKPVNKKIWRGLATICMLLTIVLSHFLVNTYNDMGIVPTICMLFISPIFIMFPLGVASLIETYRRKKVKK